MTHPTLTVFTPTYNRRDLLPVLYESLKAQTCKDFLWLIVDDGSQDDTQSLVESFQDQGQVDIRYHYQKNGGKHMAHNQGVMLCDTELFVCIDSDDYLYPDAVEVFLDAWAECRDDGTLCGVLAAREMSGHARFIDPPERSCLMDLYNRGQFVGEATLAFRTALLKEHLFPEIPGERFLSECVIYHPIDRKYEYRVLNRYVACGDYQDDGLTAHMRAIEWKNPSSTLVMLGTVAAYQTDAKTAMKAYGSYLAWKTVRKARLPSTWSLPPIPWRVRLAGWLLYPLYCAKHRKRKKELTA